ncbi:MAG: glycine/betaine ABC transporter substrate-binding protein [Pseudanabaena frigida]|uniref:Glycine/betaine ABC transporter substrate-binding protein n=1 Tax=Pseudanabaena frigida TaxID=945775 RepID=A0A2W4W3A9_9CYAN|nr:MAG: glycine/betaine ABC transporter substrate-binding protein [Pseudanabaena frigida]
MTVAIAIGIPLGILITRKPRFAPAILGIANALQTIPSLAIFGFLISVPFLGGIGKVPAIVALTVYALLPLIRNTYIGIENIDPAIREAGKGMGMTDWQLLTQVELPLASGVILAGIRVATVISVGIATIAAAIGGGGLGVFIFRGISTVNNQLILAGAIPAALIALGADFGLGLLEKQLNQKTALKLGFNRRLAIILGVITAIIVISVAFSFQATASTIIIGSKNFTEQVILGELLSQQIETKTKLKVDRRFNLGGTFICHEAVKAGQIAGYVEYTGTAFTAVLKQDPISDPQAVYTKVKEDYSKNFNLEVLPSLGFNNTFAIAIRGEDARRFNIKTISQASQYTSQWQAGFGYEFLERADGYAGLAKAYGLKFAKPPQQMEIGLMYQALAQKKVDLIAGNSTDGLIPVLDLFILEDDKNYFPPYQAVPIFNQATLQKYPEVRTSINKLAGLISNEDMQKMNYQVDNQSRPVEVVVREWLKSKSKI